MRIPLYISIFTICIGVSSPAFTQSQSGQLTNSIETAAIPEPSFPILLHAGGCVSGSCTTPAKACALTRPFQLDARLALQTNESNDNTVPVYLNLVKQFEKLRSKNFSLQTRISNPTLIRGIFFDALSGNEAAYKLLKRVPWPKKIKDQYQKAFLQLDEYKRLCPLIENPKTLEIDPGASFYPFAGVITWADSKSIAATLDRQLPENDIKVRWPLSEAIPPISSRLSRIGISTDVSLFAKGSIIGRATAVRNSSTSEIELVHLPRKLRTTIISIGRRRESVAITNRNSPKDPDQWKSIRLPTAKFEAIAEALKSNEGRLEKQSYFSEQLKIYLVQLKSKNETSNWFEINAQMQPKALEAGFEPLVAADFLSRGHSQWLGRTREGKIMTIDL